ncbi:hypothetical protein [Alloactinosynnema sp. L-07]|uniref:hypothetical protein n=1 Tax=Alloactinosynnema sp. L-07 TaxID=1653480 RepID=UPI00065EFC38|nr:hypothetical protein [Alloactinosynnema sp. L-07]CRK61729.1 hypothetical protein [Alloactinosynnema sp. L-07]
MLDEQEETPAPSRAAGRRGRPALSRLRTTADFTNDKLSPDDRKLVLFLLVVLVDENDSLSESYRAVAEEYGHLPGHWAYGSDLGDLQKKCSKFLGRGARRRPRWEEIRDVLAVAVSDGNRPVITAMAAGLYCRAATLRSPGSGYTGVIRLPSWIDDPEVSRGQIHDSVGAVTVSRPREIDPPSARESAVQAVLHARLRDQRSEFQRREHQLRREVGEAHRRGDALAELAQHYLRLVHPGVSDDYLRRVFIADLNARIDSLPRR